MFNKFKVLIVCVLLPDKSPKMENSEMNKLMRKLTEIIKTPVKVRKISSSGKKYSPRKS